MKSAGVGALKERNGANPRASAELRRMSSSRVLACVGVLLHLAPVAKTAIYVRTPAVIAARLVASSPTQR